MARIYAEFRCVGQGMERTDENILAEGACGTVGAGFDLCGKWDGLDVYAHFQHCAAGYDVPLEEGAAEVPADVMKRPGFFVSLFGDTGEGERLTSERVFVEVRPSLDAAGVPAPQPSKTLLEVFAAKVQECMDMAAALRADADAGAFDGDPFSVSHVFESVAAMEAHEGAEVGAFAVINSGAGQEDNARVYQKRADGWLYLADMSGLPGKDGKDGEAAVLGAEITAESDGKGTWTFGVRNTTDVSGLPVPVPVGKGGTGATDAETARANIGAAAADHDHEGLYSKASHTHTLSSLGAAAWNHGHAFADLEGVAAAKHTHAAADVADMAAYVVAQGVTDFGQGSIRWEKFSNGLGIAHINYSETPVSEIRTATGSLYKSDNVDVSLPFKMSRANAFGSVPGWITEVRAVVKSAGDAVQFFLRSTAASSTTGRPVITVIGHWE